MESYLEGQYNKIPNSIRDRLVEMVVVDKTSIKEAATCLKLKYSTAKTIYKIYKKENRTFKYSSRSRNPGVSRDMINKISKAPLPTFIIKRSHQLNLVCGIADKNLFRNQMLVPSLLMESMSKDDNIIHFQRD